MKKYLFLMIVLGVMNLSAQRFIDDIYFTPKNAQKEHIQKAAKTKNGAREVVFVKENSSINAEADTLLVEPDTTTATLTDEMVMNLAEGTYLNGFEGDANDMEYTQRIYRFHNPRITVQVGDPGYTDIYFLDNDLWNVYIDPYNTAYVTPTWTNPYYWDYMYRPYAYGSWTWRWNPYGSWAWHNYWDWNWGYTNCWHCYDPFWGYPYWAHHHHHLYPPHHPPHHGLHPNYHAQNKAGEQRRKEGVRMGSQIDRKTAIMGGSTAGNRINSTTVLAGERAENKKVQTNGNDRRVPGITHTTSSHRGGISTASRTQDSRRVASTQSRVSTTPRTGASDVRRTNSSSRGNSYTPFHRTTTTTAGRTETRYREQVTTSTGRAQVSSGYTPSNRGSHSSSYSGTRSSSSYRSSAPARSSSSSSYRSGSSGSRSSGSYSSSSSSRSGSSSSGGSRSGSGRR